MALKVVSTVNIGNRTFKVKRVNPFILDYTKEYLEATAIQLRILAYSLKDYIIDKLLAQVPELGRPVLYREKKNPKEIPDIPDEQKRIEPDLIKRRKNYIQPRQTPEPIAERFPFIHRPLRKKYLKRKIKRKRDPRILLATGDYVNGIVVRKRKDPNEGTYYVVTVANRLHKETKVPLSTIAIAHEFGARSVVVKKDGKEVTVKLPTRPHWRPAMRRLKLELEKLGEAVKARALKSAIQKIK